MTRSYYRFLLFWSVVLVMTLASLRTYLTPEYFSKSRNNCTCFLPITRYFQNQKKQTGWDVDKTLRWLCFNCNLDDFDQFGAPAW